MVISHLWTDAGQDVALVAAQVGKGEAAGRRLVICENAFTPGESRERRPSSTEPLFALLLPITVPVLLRPFRNQLRAPRHRTRPVPLDMYNLVGTAVNVSLWKRSNCSYSFLKRFSCLDQFWYRLALSEWPPIHITSSCPCFMFVPLLLSGYMDICSPISAQNDRFATHIPS